MWFCEEEMVLLLEGWLLRPALSVLTTGQRKRSLRAVEKSEGRECNGGRIRAIGEEKLVLLVERSRKGQRK